ncbi:hypothetical protein NDU88_004479 [Pleurodeles waltl]|uniref:Uncharacterized protein n=1 Tax=Pleurodeles waltl TaxID=8319 RepID=A0AAV7LLU8_PLEWA|nr:hypothetical protein NDU88_004479 [Pleurodeles waltl]
MQQHPSNFWVCRSGLHYPPPCQPRPDDPCLGAADVTGEAALVEGLAARYHSARTLKTSRPPALAVALSVGPPGGRSSGLAAVDPEVVVMMACALREPLEAGNWGSSVRPGVSFLPYSGTHGEQTGRNSF